MTYDFACKNCTHEFTKSMTFKEYGNKKVRCPKCKSLKVRRAYTTPVEIRFKGAGFYSTDNKKGN